MDHEPDSHGAIVTPYENGPLLIRGDFTLRTPDGTVIEPGRGTVALCRCGKSASKPFCDGTHKAIGFRAGTGRDNESPRDAADPAA
jgi:CDGSH-type Zn-finger protein